MATKKHAAVNTSRLGPQLIVLRKVDMSILERRDRPDQESTYALIGKGQLEAGVSEADTVWFGQGFIANDQPRSSGITDGIIACTTGFAVARTDNGEIIAELGPNELEKAEKLVSGATLSLNVDVQLEDPEDEVPADFDPDDMGAFAAAQASSK